MVKLLDLEKRLQSLEKEGFAGSFTGNYYLFFIINNFKLNNSIYNIYIYKMWQIQRQRKCLKKM